MPTNTNTHFYFVSWFENQRFNYLLVVCSLHRRGLGFSQANIYSLFLRTQASWTESKLKLEKDPQGRASNPDLDSTEMEKLFRDHIKMLHEVSLLFYVFCWPLKLILIELIPFKDFLAKIHYIESYVPMIVSMSWYFCWCHVLVYFIYF